MKAARPIVSRVSRALSPSSPAEVYDAAELELHDAACAFAAIDSEQDRIEALHRAAYQFAAAGLLVSAGQERK